MVYDDETGHMLAVISVEIDENSHAGRLVECELGKIDDTFQVAGTWAKRHGADAVQPLSFTFKLNPHTCDVSDANLDDRRSVLAVGDPLPQLRARHVVEGVDAARHKLDALLPK